MKLPRLLFAVVLLTSGLVTGFLGARTLFDPERVMQAFDVPVANAAGLDLLIAVLGGALVSLAAVVLLAAWWSWRGLREGRTLGMLCGATLLLVAVCGWYLAGSMEVLVLDGVRGSSLLVLGLLWRPAPVDR